jgi:hypothetical protein
LRWGLGSAAFLLRQTCDHLCIDAAAHTLTTPQSLRVLLGWSRGYTAAPERLTFACTQIESAGARVVHDDALRSYLAKRISLIQVRLQVGGQYGSRPNFKSGRVDEFKYRRTNTEAIQSSLLEFAARQRLPVYYSSLRYVVPPGERPVKTIGLLVGFHDSLVMPQHCITSF